MQVGTFDNATNFFAQSTVKLRLFESGFKFQNGYHRLKRLMPSGTVLQVGDLLLERQEVLTDSKMLLTVGFLLLGLVSSGAIRYPICEARDNIGLLAHEIEG